MFKNMEKLAGELVDGLREAGFFIFLALRAFAFWRKEAPVTDMAGLARFAEARAKFATQTTLFGYIKARAGTRYTLLFTDEKYATSINIAKWEIYLASLGDICIYISALIGRHGALGADDMRAMAIHLLNTVLDNEEIPKERPQGFDDIREKFSARARNTNWDEAAGQETAFGESLNALVEWAPIADELKVLDAEIVRNSMRFKWKKVRDDFKQLLDAEKVLAEWRSPHHGIHPAGAT